MKKLVREYIVDEEELTEKERNEICNNYDKSDINIKYDKDNEDEENTSKKSKEKPNKTTDDISLLVTKHLYKVHEEKDKEKFIRQTKSVIEQYIEQKNLSYLKSLVDYFSNNILRDTDMTPIPLDTFLTLPYMKDSYNMYEHILDILVNHMSPDTLEGTRQIKNFINNDLDFYYDLFSNALYREEYKNMFIECAKKDKPTGETISSDIEEFCKKKIRIPGLPFNNPKDRFRRKFIKEIHIPNLITITDEEFKKEILKHIPHSNADEINLEPGKNNNDNDGKGNIYGKIWYINPKRKTETIEVEKDNKITKEKITDIFTFDYFIDADVIDDVIYLYEPLPPGEQIVEQNTQLDNKGNFEEKYQKQLDKLEKETEEESGGNYKSIENSTKNTGAEKLDIFHLKF